MKFGISLGRTHSSLWPKLTRRADELGFEPKSAQAGGPALHLGGDDKSAVRRRLNVSPAT